MCMDYLSAYLLKHYLSIQNIAVKLKKEKNIFDRYTYTQVA